MPEGKVDALAKCLEMSRNGNQTVNVLPKCFHGFQPDCLHVIFFLTSPITLLTSSLTFVNICPT